MQFIEIEVEKARARFILRPDIAPRSSFALWENLPIQGPIRHSMLSGEACFIQVQEGPLTQLPVIPEFGVTSIYRGFLVVVPLPAEGKAEILISYGQAEYRCPTGRRHITPIAEIEGDGTAFFEVLKRTHSEGEKFIKIWRVAE